MSDEQELLKALSETVQFFLRGEIENQAEILVTIQDRLGTVRASPTDREFKESIEKQLPLLRQRLKNIKTLTTNLCNQRDHHFVLRKTLDSVRLVERIAALNKTRSAEFVLYQLITEAKEIVTRKQAG